MAVEAAGKALAHSGVAAAAIDRCSSRPCTHPYQTPSASAEVADRLGTSGAAAFDVGAACAGFCYALAHADALIRTGTAEHVLVVGVEKLTDFVDPTDREHRVHLRRRCRRRGGRAGRQPGIGPVVWGSDGSQIEAITMTQSWIEYRDEPGRLAGADDAGPGGVPLGGAARWPSRSAGP